MKKRKKRSILCAIGAALFAVAIPQMDSPEPAEIVMAVVIVLVLAFVAVRSLFPNLRLRKKSKASKAAAAPHQREDSQQQRSFPVASRPLADAPAPKQACQPVEPAPVAASAQTVEQPRFIDVEALRRGIVRQPDAPKYQHYEFHVAGVTYKSDDGTPRREYLRRIDSGIAPFENSDSLDVSLCPYMYKEEGKPEEQAISVRVNGYDIGNVPRESVPAVMEAMHKPGAIISAFKVIGGYEGKNYGAIVVVRHDL